MRAAIFNGPKQPQVIDEVDIDQPKGREVLVRTVACGVCHSDLHFADGVWPMMPPAILGHETAGIIEEVGSDVTEFKPGDHVIACLALFCGTCEKCLSGSPHLCFNTRATDRKKDQRPRLLYKGKPIQGILSMAGFAEQQLLHENAVVRIPDDIPLDRAALVGCGVTTGVGAALNTAKVEPGSTVAVFGCGGIGLAAVQGARIAGALQIIAVDMFESKLAMAKRLGATDTVDASAGDPVAAIMSLSGRGVDYSFECIGLKKVAEQAIACLKPGGTATVIGMIPLTEKVEMDAPSLLSERKLQGCFMGSSRFRLDAPKYLQYYRQGRLNLDDMVTRKAGLGDVDDAFRAMKAGEVVRTVIMFE
jgi:S-(hydroxymethyl)glutathione dehydrogenase/alcohol dehydrogenase